MLLCLSVMADDKDCRGGDKDKKNDNDHSQEMMDGVATSGGISYDPNEVLGPTGYDSLRWVSINDILNYTIFFENSSDFATANAQKVDVRFNFADKAAMKGFGLGTYGFANQSWNIEDAPAAYQNRLDLRDSMKIYVDLTAGIDVVKQQAFWLFNSIDPETGYNPWQVDRGMLPVNDSTHVGEGFVTFRLKPWDDLKTGDTISIVASIVFDQNDTIPTNRWRNTIDAGMPTSKVKGRQDSKNENLYHLTLQAVDDEGGSGLRRVLLYQANNFGIYEEVATCPIDTVIDFMAEPGHQYRFYSIAEDNVGNREPLKEQPDLIININAAPTDIALSDTIFQDDIAAGGFIAELTSEDIEQDGSFTYALAEGDGAIHNDLFQITGTQLQAKQQFKCAGDSCYKIRLSTTDEGGLSFSKAFNLDMKKVLIKPKVDTLNISICEGESCRFNGVEYNKTGQFKFSKENEYMCDSLFVLNLSVLPRLEEPTVSIEGTYTLVSSAAKGNQWFREDGRLVPDATGQKFTPEEDGIYYVAVSNGSCYSDPSRAYRVQLSDHIDLEMDLKTGWNWVSSSLAEPAHQDAKEFLKPIETVTERFVGIADELINDPVYGLTGGLSMIQPTESYKLKVSENVVNVWKGKGCKPEATTVNLHKGWNWLGYVPVSGNDLSAALVGITPTENDVIKCMDDFSTYTGGKWVGTLTRLKPGEGYMYYATNATSFMYPSIRVFPVSSESTVRQDVTGAAPWHYDNNRYPDNTTLVGRLYVDGAPTVEGAYTVGAFCNDECRGIGKYVGDILFLTIHGTLPTDHKVTFKAFENVTGNEYTIEETIRFNGQQEGCCSSPFALHANKTTGIEYLTTEGYTIYPKPLRSRLYVNGNTDNIKSIKILSSNGVVNISQNGYSDNGVDVSALLSGVYVVAIVSTDGEVYYEKVVKAQNE